MFLMRSAFSLQGLWRESNHCLSNLSVRGKSEKKDMYFVWVKVLLRTGICRTLLVLRRRPLLHTQIPGGFQHSQTHSYLLLERFCFPWAPSHSCFQWKRWVPHSDLCYHGLKKLLLSSYGWNQNARRVAIRVNKASPNHQDFDQYCGLTQTHVNLGHWTMAIFWRREFCPLLSSGRKTLGIVEALLPTQRKFPGRGSKECASNERITTISCTGTIR